MALLSTLFAGNRELEFCQLEDRAHLTHGTRGYQVRLVQTALIRLGFGGIHGIEFIQGHYGATTAGAVLRYKTSRQIINRAYQTSPDDIVGKMTITRLDQEMVDIESRWRARL